VLLGIAARGPALVDRGEPLPGEAGRLGVDRLDVLDLDAEVVQRSALSGILEQEELERGLGDRTVRVAGTALGRLSAEQPCVERDRLVDVVDVEGELDSGHDGCFRCETSMSINVLASTWYVTWTSWEL